MLPVRRSRIRVNHPLTRTSDNVDNDQTVPAYRNPELPIETRTADLISRMTLDEKISQMSSGAAAIPRLGVPAYNYWNEALHGVARAGRATVRASKSYRCT